MSHPSWNDVQEFFRSPISIAESSRSIARSQLELRAIGEMILSKLDDLLIAVARENTLTQSVITLLNGFSQGLKEAGTDQLKLDQLKTMIDTNTAALAQAVQMNTAGSSTGTTDSGSTDSTGGDQAASSGAANSDSTDTAEIPAAAPGGGSEAQGSQA